MFEHTQEHASQWAAITSIAEKIGCAAETLRKWVRQAERDGGRRPGLATDEQRDEEAQSKDSDERVPMRPGAPGRLEQKRAWEPPRGPHVG